MSTFDLSSLSTILLIVSSIALYVGYYIRKKYSYWERRGVPHLKPNSLFFGNTADRVLMREPNALFLQRIYNELDGHKFGGFYNLMKPVLLIRDPELIRSIFVKNFSHFQDRVDGADFIIDEKLDPLSSNLLNLTGQRWKNVRHKLTPTFSPSKLRAMEELMRGCISELDDYLSEVTYGNSKDSGVVNVQDLMRKLTTDIISTCAFGLKCNSIRDENFAFIQILKLAFKPSLKSHLRTILRQVAPGLVNPINRLAGLKTFPMKVEQFFISILKEAVKHRETNAEKRKDFMQLLIDIQAEEMKQKLGNNQQRSEVQDVMKNGHFKDATTTEDILFTDTVVASNAFVFLIAGYDTTATTLSHCLYELALNPHVCSKLKDEVESVKKSHGGDVDYDALKELVYMDTVISETLRKHPPVGSTSRFCTEAFQIPDTSVVVERGIVAVSIYGLHHDPKYFPEPEEFRPERFSEESRENIVPGSYLPFGDGPRNCIGMRFAQHEMKSVLSRIVSNYTIHTCEKTAIPLEYSSGSPLHVPKGGVWLKFKKIN